MGGNSTFKVKNYTSSAQLDQIFSSLSTISGMISSGEISSGLGADALTTLSGIISSELEHYGLSDDALTTISGLISSGLESQRISYEALATLSGVISSESESEWLKELDLFTTLSGLVVSEFKAHGGGVEVDGGSLTSSGVLDGGELFY